MEELAKFKNLVGFQDFMKDRPRTFLAGAEVRQAKSLAMGSAVTKGWKIIDATGRKLLIARRLDNATTKALIGE